MLARIIASNSGERGCVGAKRCVCQISRNNGLPQLANRNSWNAVAASYMAWRSFDSLASLTRWASRSSRWICKLGHVLCRQARRAAFDLLPQFVAAKHLLRILIFGVGHDPTPPACLVVQQALSL